MSLRITQNVVTTLMLSGLENNQNQLSKLELQLSSGKKITKPSDDPVGTDQAMQFRTQIARNNQYQTNANDGLAWLGTADSALQSGVQILNRLQVLTTQAANTGSGDSTSRSAIATEVASLKQEMLGAANTTYLNRPIFGGTTSGSAAYSQDSSSGAVTYQGDTGAVMRTVADNTQVQVNVNASDAFGSDTTGTDPNNSVFAMFDQITNDLQNNPSNLSNDLSLISTSLGRMSNAQAIEGAAYNRITDMNTQATNQVTNLTGTLSSVEDVDDAQAATELTMQQTSYQAALSAMSNILQLSLTEFLK